MTTDSNRLLLELEKYRREVNRDIINPQIPELALEDLKPVLTLVANARARYLVKLLEISEQTGDGDPAQEDIHELQHLRETFDTLVDAVNALETVIQRDYLDVRSTRLR